MASNWASTGVNVNELTELAGVRECLQFFTREKQWINESHLEFCRVPAPTFMEGERAKWFLDKFRSFGWEAAIDRAGNVAAWLGPGPYIAATAHLDTVLAPRSKDDIAVDAEGRFRGPGVSDNGAGLAALLAIARACKTARMGEFIDNLLLVANTGEEGEGNLMGMRYLCRQSPLAKLIKGFVVVDGANMDHITTRALGSRRFEVTFSGPGGHSWSDFGVGNPVHALCRAVAAFAETRIDGSPKSSVNVGLIEGGSGVNAIAQQARAKVDIRSEDNGRIEEIVDALATAVDRAREYENQRATSGRVASRMKEIGSRPAAALPDDSPLLGYLRAVDAHLGIRSHLDTSSTDANIPLSLGIPAVALGAGGIGGGAHTSQEWFSPDGRDLGLKRIFLTLTAMLRNGAGGNGIGK
jgi:acetylornithine deacetylase/succinyl-diaminopimelate desuccinylase-like protein